MGPASETRGRSIMIFRAQESITTHLHLSKHVHSRNQIICSKSWVLNGLLKPDSQNTRFSDWVVSVALNTLAVYASENTIL